MSQKHPWSRYVAIGDSFTEGIGDPEPQSPGGYRGWADRVAEVLGAQPGGLAPGQPLVGRNRLTRSGIDHVPLEHRHALASRFRRGVYPRIHKLVRHITHPHWRDLPKERRCR